jgi:hypothetical protein
MATHAQDPITLTITSVPVSLVAQDAIGSGSTAPVATSLVPASGSIDQAADVQISFRIN